MPRHFPQIAVLSFSEGWVGSHESMLPAVVNSPNAAAVPVSGRLAELGGGPAGGAAMAVLQGAERLAEDRGHALTR